ncbi:Cation efflux protein [Dioscorea alata]|uniref:Cation efflux protein n=1 Tax=Dioscorea alata TaxID=55571 RepID=A0ACB7VUA7_DIOAL|nr:Cation efflux protein [Dioscorea alata]
MVRKNSFFIVSRPIRRQRGVMAEMKECEEDSELLPAEDREREASWRLNFDGFRTPQHREKDKPDRGLHNFLCALGSEDVVAEYYEQQVQMLDGFSEMDTLADRGFLPGVSKGILVFASVMATLGLQIILESIRSLMSDENGFILTKEQEEWVVGIMVSVTIVKLLLVIYCRSFTNEIVKAYAQDHFFDVITNVIGLVAALLANYIKDWIDPIGAIILAVYTIRTWSMTVLENVNSLVGRTAAPEYLQKLTYLCWNHHKAIRHIDTVRAYTFGSHYFVEVDIVLPSEMALREAHDIGEALQEKLESLPDIERAFVHLDYEFTHRPEHAQACYDT